MAVNSNPTHVRLQWHRRTEGAWLAERFSTTCIADHSVDYSRTIETLAHRTNQQGLQQLWSGYPAGSGRQRHPDQVRTSAHIGRVFTEIVKQRRPDVIVEFGTAFGVSGMYWLAGLEQNAQGRLLTFEPNRDWAAIAKHNLQQIGNRFDLTVGTFEDHVDHVLSRTIDIAFIDAIHTADYLVPQVQMVRDRCSPGALIVLDDINFSDEMKHCWSEFSETEDYVASLSMNGRVGILEVP